MASLWKSTVVTLEMIKWEHSIFALPFALTGAVLAAGGWPALRVLGWIVVCMVAARSAAMAFNRLVDARAGCGESADGDAGSCRRESLTQRVCRWVCSGFGRGVCAGCGDAEPADAGACAAGAGGGAGLQLHEAGDAVVAPGAGAWRWGLRRRRHGLRCADRSTGASWC